jgi:hypothetical protein
MAHAAPEDGRADLWTDRLGAHRRGRNAALDANLAPVLTRPLNGANTAHTVERSYGSRRYW